MSSQKLLPFQNDILRQLSAPSPDSDGLLLLARGLGMRNILCAYLETFTDDEESLVILVNATPEEERGLAEELGMRMTVIGFEMPAKDRQKLYEKGGVLSITTRILIIDMLNERIPVSEMTGIVVLHAEAVTPTSMEAFVMRVYREKNKRGFIKAFSDEPESFTYGVAPLQTVLTQLQIRHVFLYPRFHETVSRDLEAKGADVLNLHQPLSENMDIIQTAIIECMDATLAELKRSNNIIEVEELTVQNALFRSFDTVIKAQLDPHWHRIGPQTRQLVNDLATLRQLLSYLLSFDAVSFHQFLETILASNTTNLTTGRVVVNQSPWLFLPAADTIFETARNRVYKKVSVQAKEGSVVTNKTTNGSSKTANGRSAAARVPSEAPNGDDSLWDGDDDSLFADEALLAASQGPASTSSPSKSNGSTSNRNIHDLTGEDEEDDEDTSASGSRQSEKAKGKRPEEAGSQAPVNYIVTKRADLLAAASVQQETPGEQQWAYWCPKGTVPVLEEQPKWFLLREILEEIENQIHWTPVNYEEQSNDSILIMCSSARTVTTLRRYLSSIPELDRDAKPPPNESSLGGRDLLLARASEYFLWKGSIGKMTRNIRSAGSTANNVNYRKDPNQPTDYGAVLANANKPGGLATDRVPYESAALKRKSAYKHGQPINKRRRVRGGGAAGYNFEGRSANSKEKKPAGLSANILEAEAEELADKTAHEGAGVLPNSLQEPDEEFDAVAFNEYFGLCSVENTVIIRSYAGDEDDKVLEELRPRYVILYDPDPSYVRRIETYRAANPGMRIQTYFMIYANSAEEQRYLSYIRRERESFERLIKERASMAIPLQADRRTNEDRSDDYLRTVSSRIAGGGKHARSDPPKVIVDVREFRSSLPSLLHAAGFIVVPLTLTIGDYVISPEMVVERKSLPDLIQSFNSGRLYQQCEVMSTHYKIPILLIEFDQKKSFSLETYSDVKGNTHQNPDTDLHSKLVLLTLTFPRLRIIWSSSPYATADIYADLKQNRDEPDATKAASLGADAADAAAGEAEAVINQTPQDLLRSLPGITSQNYHYVMRKVNNMEELARCTLAELNEIIGVEAGRELHTFLNHSLLKSTQKTLQLEEDPSSE